MGLLWVKHQLLYQSSIFGNVVKVLSYYESVRDAVDAAYTQIYGKYHSWVVQKIFKYSFQAAPDAEKIFCHMNPHKLTEAKAEALHTFGKANLSENILADEIFIGNKESESDDPFVVFLDRIGGEWDKFAEHVMKEWDKFAYHVVEIFDKKAINSDKLIKHWEES